MKKYLVVANFKMKLASKNEIETWLKNFSKASKAFFSEKVETVLCTPYPFLEKFSEITKKDEFLLGAQNCFWEDEGAYTGEVSAKMLKSMGVDFVILGHSERRKYFDEQNLEIARKVEKAFKNRIIPIICVGENREEKENDLTMKVVLKQLQDILEKVGRGNIEKTILCYEPIWAISDNGPNRMSTSNEIMEARLLIKKFLVDKYGQLTAERVKIIYGGSVDNFNVEETCIKTGMEGALVGSVSTKPYEFIKIIEKFNEK
ncbi:MAG: triose-phosphate isomerase [Candidatus Moranbacteria bacterium]|nr:triose-phosphate isomerase [Candidatus Moranbacteria bacterium]